MACINRENLQSQSLRNIQSIWRDKILLGETKGTNMEKRISQVRVNRRKAQ